MSSFLKKHTISETNILNEIIKEEKNEETYTQAASKASPLDPKKIGGLESTIFKLDSFANPDIIGGIESCSPKTTSILENTTFSKSKNIRDKKSLEQYIHDLQKGIISKDSK